MQDHSDIKNKTARERVKVKTRETRGGGAVLTVSFSLPRKKKFIKNNLKK